jgi:hypothetical protein
MVLFCRNTTIASVCPDCTFDWEMLAEDGLEKTEACSHTGVLMIVCLVGLRQNKTILF